MRAVLADVPASFLDDRRRTGADRWDEIWDGVLHMPPMPNREHQDLEGALETWLREFWGRPHGNKVYHQINLASPGGWPNRDYRVPDLVLLTPDCFHIDHNEYFEGAPTVVVEIHSPNEESYEKLAFYHGLRVPEVWIVHRDTRQPEIHVWGDQEYTVARANENGSVRSSATHIEMRASEDRHLIVRFAGDVATERGLPE